MSTSPLSLSFNERQTFALVHRNKKIDRTTISELTGLTATTVSRLVTRLLDLGLLKEMPDRSGQLGQPRKMLSVRPRQVYSIGVNFMRGRFDIALVDLCGEIARVDTIRIEEVTAGRIAETAASRSTEILARCGIDRDSVVGAGFSVPGGFSPDGETLLAHEWFPDLDRQTLAPMFSEALGMPCSTDTDGACATLGEYLYGQGVDHSTFFLLHLGHGVGGGAIIDGQLYRGAHRNASKPGVLFPYGAPRPSGQDLLTCLIEAGHDIQDIADLDRISPESDSTVIAWLDRAAQQIGELGRVITAFLDPETIIVGGRLPQTFNDALLYRLGKIELPGPSRGLPNAPFVASSLGPRSGVLGAASLPIFGTYYPGADGTTGNPYINGRRTM